MSACAICGLFSAVLAEYIKRKKSPKLKNVIDYKTLEASKHLGKNLLRTFHFWTSLEFLMTVISHFHHIHILDSFPLYAILK
jgi:hypothetical protein